MLPIHDYIASLRQLSLSPEMDSIQRQAHLTQSTISAGLSLLSCVRSPEFTELDFHLRLQDIINKTYEHNADSSQCPDIFDVGQVINRMTADTLDNKSSTYVNPEEVKVIRDAVINLYHHCVKLENAYLDQQEEVIPNLNEQIEDLTNRLSVKGLPTTGSLIVVEKPTA